MWIAITAQLLTCVIALGLLWKDWSELRKKARYLPPLVLLATLVLTLLSIVLVANGIRDAERLEAGHKGEAQQFQTTLSTLLDRMGALQKQVNTEPLLQQNQKLQQDLSDTKKLIQSTKDQLGKPAPKAMLEAMFAESKEDIAKRQKNVNAMPLPDGSIEFEILVVNTSDERAGKGSVLVRLCDGCIFVKEPERFHKIIGAPDCDREMFFDAVDAGISLAIPLKVKAPTNTPRFEVEVTSRCENCKVRETDQLFVSH